MRHRNPQDRRCTYVVPLEESTASQDDLRSLAEYLSTIAVGDCDVLVLDGSSNADTLDANRSVLRWVARHIAVGSQYRTASGAVDAVRAAIALAPCEKVIVAGADVRYAAEELQSVCDLLELHEVVEPQDYLDPLPWWGSVDAARMLVHRSIEPYPDHGATFGFRRSAIRGLRGIDVECNDDHVRRLASQGAEIFSALDLFVRRRPSSLGEWMRERARQAEDDFAMPMKTAFFFALIPVTLLMLAFAGTRTTLGYTGAVAFASVALAVRGRVGAGRFFPLSACFFAPLWLLERSMSVYWALALKLRGREAEPGRIVIAEGARGERVASGE